MAVIPIYGRNFTRPYRRKFGRDFYGRQMTAVPVKWAVRSPRRGNQARIFWVASWVEITEFVKTIPLIMSLDEEGLGPRVR